MSSVALLTRRYPAFDGLDEELIEEFISDAVAEIDPEFFGSDFTRAVVALAAHGLWVREQSANGEELGGQITSVKTGDYSISYAASGDDPMLSLNLYGQEYLRLRRRNALPLVV